MFEGLRHENAHNFAYFVVPKALVTNERFHISYGAILLYGLMLDRAQLSSKNNWVDKNGYVYIIFRNDEVKEMLRCSHTTAAKLFAELDMPPRGAGLIEIVNQGKGEPRLIFVKDFTKPLSNPPAEQTSRMLKSRLQESGSLESGSQDFQNVEVKKVEVKTSRMLKSNIRNNKTDFNKTENLHPITSKDSGIDAPLLEQADRMDAIITQVKGQIDYDDTLITWGIDRAHLDELVLIIADVYATAQSELTIQQQTMSTASVRARYGLLTGDHIAYVAESYLKVDHPISNPRAYLRTALFNAPTTIDLAAKQEVTFYQREFMRKKEAEQKNDAKAEREKQIVAAMALPDDAGDD